MENKKVFEKDARVAFIGDSITHNGLYVEYIQQYYLTHFPERRVRVYNLGIGGDAAAHSLGRVEDMLSVNPTEVVVAFCGNDLGLSHYGPAPTEEDIARRTALRQKHTEGMLALVERLGSHGLPITLTSAIGRDEFTAGSEGTCSLGATDALYAMYEADVAALGDRLKNAVDYLTPMMALQAELARHGANLFRVDRTHANDLGQAVMACLFLRGQGLPVGVPSAEDILMGWREQPLSESLRARRDAGVRWRDLTWVYPHQQDRTHGLSLCERIAFWKKELSRTDLSPYFVRMYENYVENAESEPALFGEYMALSDALYTSGSIGGEGELLRI